MQAVVLTFDRLPISFLGCYGNSSVQTPHFDRLAARSVVFDQHFAERIDSTAPRHAWTTGCYHFPRTFEQQAAMPHLADALRAGGVETTLIAEKGAPTPVTGFDRDVEVVGRDGLGVTFEATPFAELVSRSESVLDGRPNQQRPVRLLWLKSRGVPLPWLPPRAIARAAIKLFIEASGGSRPSVGHDDAATIQPSSDVLSNPADAGHPTRSVHEFTGGNERIGDERIEIDGNRPTDHTASVFELPDDQFDPFVSELVAAAATKVLGIPNSPRDVSQRDAPDESPTAAPLSAQDWHIARALFAGYVALLDKSLGRLLELVEERFRTEQVLLIVTAAQGWPVGERLMMSLPKSALPEEVVHVPLIVRVSGGDAGTRRQTLVQTVDVAPTLLDWFQLTTEAASCEGRSLIRFAQAAEPNGRDYICLGDGAQAAGIRTPERYLVSELREGVVEPAAGGRLTVKPDDVWDVHDVAAQSLDEVEMLSSTLAEFIHRASRSTPLQWPTL